MAYKVRERRQPYRLARVRSMNGFVAKSPHRNGRYNEELVKAGVMLAGKGLHRGFWIWQVGSKEEPIEWARAARTGRSIACRDGQAPLICRSKFYNVV